MSDDKISLDFLGEQMLRVQADLRGVRAEQVKMESEQANIRADMRNVDAKVDRVDAKVDNLARSMEAQFEQVNRIAATNLDIVLKALDAKRD